MDLLVWFSKYQKFILYSFLCLAIVAFFDKALAIGFVFVAFLCAIAFLFLNKNKQQARVLCLLFLIAFSIHLAAVLFVHYTNFQPFSDGKGDYIEYQYNAEIIAERLHRGSFSFEGLRIDHCYSVIVGYIYAFTMPNMLLGQILNAWLAALISIFVYLIVVEIGRSKKEGFWAGIIASAYPSLLFFGSLLLKDAFVVLMSSIVLLYILKLIKKFSLREFLIFYIAMAGLVHFRFYIGYATMLTFVVCWLFFSSLDFKKRIIYLIIIIVLLGFLPMVFAHQGYFGFYSFKTFLTPKNITFSRETIYAPPVQSSQPAAPQSAGTQPASPSRGKDSSILIKTGFDNPFTFLKNSALSLIYSLLGPFPWQMAQKKHLFMLLETIPWYFLFFFIIKGIVKSVKKQYKDILPLVIFAVVAIGVLSVFMTNFGLIARIRMPAFVALFCLIPFGFTKLNNIKIPFLEKYIFG